MKYLFQKDAEGKSVLSKLFNNKVTDELKDPEKQRDLKDQCKKMAMLQRSRASESYGDNIGEKIGRGLTFVSLPLTAAAAPPVLALMSMVEGCSQHKKDVENNQKQGPNLNKM